MKIDEAINILKQYIDYDNTDIPDFYTVAEACEVAIKALEQQPTDAVDRQAVLDCFKKWQPYMATRLFDFEKELSALPPVTPQQKMGKWIYKKEEDSYRCSLCGFPCHKDNLGAIPTKYCAGCGAYMQEVENG